MTKKNNIDEDTSDREMVFTRIFDAPRELVFEAWIDPKHLMQWWGPNGFTNTIHEINVKPGGIWRFIMHGPDGVNYPEKIVYDEVVAPERLVFRHVDDKENESVLFQTIVTFVNQDGKTKLTMRAIFPSTAERDRLIKEHGVKEGGNQTLDRLGSLLTNIVTKSLIITCIFDAPRELVFKAWTDPKLIEKWWGPRGVTNPICKLDAGPGGAIHIVMLAGKDLGDLEGQEWPMKGTFDEIIRPERIVFTSSAIEDKDGNPQLEQKVTIMFEDLEGKTKMTLHVVVTKAGPGTEGPLSGMKIGWNQSIDKLGEELEKHGKH